MKLIINTIHYAYCWCSIYFIPIALAYFHIIYINIFLLYNLVPIYLSITFVQIFRYINMISALRTDCLDWYMTCYKLLLPYMACQYNNQFQSRSWTKLLKAWKFICFFSMVVLVTSFEAPLWNLVIFCSILLKLSILPLYH